MAGRVKTAILQNVTPRTLTNRHQN